MKNLKEFINEAIKTSLQIPENMSMPHPWDLIDIIHELDGKLANANKVNWEDYIDDMDVFEQAESDIKQYFVNVSMLFNAWTADLGNVDEGSFSDDEVCDMADITGSGYALHSDGDDGTWSIFEFKKKPNTKEKSFAAEFFNRYNNDGWTIVEEF